MKREDLNKKVLAIVDGSNVFSRKGCKFVTKREAIEKGYLFVEGDSPREFWEIYIHISIISIFFNYHFTSKVVKFNFSSSIYFSDHLYTSFMIGNNITSSIILSYSIL